MRNEIELTDEQIEQVFEAAFGACVSMDSISLSREPLANFDHNMPYLERSKPFYAHEQGYSTLEIRDVKIAKGKPKLDVLVIDFGSVRAIHES